ncbi:MAG: hypothetical protein JWM86_1036 [Thermoleophilia bacterium]|nr:hypothetical protein [Thermoleophilia bacterium]
MRTVPIARAALVLALVALVVNVAVLVLAGTADSGTPPPGSELFRWLHPFARPAADIAIVLGFLSLLTERVGDAYAKNARTAVLIALVAIVLLPIANALLAP